MYEFLEGIISERQLLLETIPGQEYTAIYLCSIYVLPEFRKQGLSRKTMLEAISEIQKDHQIKSLYYWPFSNEGKQLATTIAEELALPLYEKSN
jgi:GNAT superfamily N-acetyltransferase